MDKRLNERLSASIPAEEPALRAEIARLQKTVDALMDRAERSADQQLSAFDAFRSTILLEDLVRSRTEELKATIRDKEKLLNELWLSEEKFRSIVYQPIVGIAVVEQRRIVFANPRIAEIFGYSIEELMEMNLAELTADTDLTHVEDMIRLRESGRLDRANFIFQGKRKNGEVRDIECHSTVVDNGGKRVIISMVNDATERMQAERSVLALQEQLRQQAIHDPLTGLYNRLPLHEFFDREICLAERHQQQLGVVMGDIDHFKRINDTYGHLAGDATLQHIAELIRASFRISDIFCRFGGEEFLILLPDTDAATTADRTELLRKRIVEQPVAYNGESIPFSASFGVSTYPRHGASRELLIEAADRAMYAAKQSGRNRVLTAS